MPRKITPRIAFFGTPDLAVPTLRWLIESDYSVVVVVTQADAPSGRGNHLASPPIKQIAVSAGIPVLQPERLDSTFIRAFKDCSPDLAVLIAYGKILPPSILQIPKKGFVNLHLSLLPKFRGSSPIQAAIREGEHLTGVTLQQIAKGVDSGMIYGSRSLHLHPREIAESLHEKLKVLAPRVLEDWLPGILDGTATPIPQDETNVSTCKKIQRNHGLLDLQNTADVLDRTIRAYTPWPGAYVFFQNKRLKILRARPYLDSQLPNGAIGMVHVQHNHVLLQCKDGFLELLEMQWEGKKPLRASAFAKGYKNLHRTVAVYS